jgi:hypothetical protein
LDAIFNRLRRAFARRFSLLMGGFVMSDESKKRKPNRLREDKICFRVTPEERKMIEQRMAQSGVKNFRAYLLKMVIDGQVVHVELSSVKEMCRLLSNATNNMNQIARRVNETGSIYAADIADLQRRYDELWAQAKLILHRVSEL